MEKLVVAYIPEHFSTPMFLADEKGYYREEGLEIEFFPVIEGSGRLIKLLNDRTVDVAVGLTEAFVADISKGNKLYSIVGTYVESPLCWAISTGKNRDDIQSAADLAGSRIGVSRIGSGSYVMSFVLGLQNNFAAPYFSDFKVVHNFQNLRDSVNLKYRSDSGEQVDSEAFMWEHFTSKKYYDSGEIKRIGEIYTPWPSWVFTANQRVFETRKSNLSGFLRAVKKGVAYFLQNPEEAVDHISTHLNYSVDDAREWLTTVKFNEEIGVKPIDWHTVVENTAEVLKTAGVIPKDDIVGERLKMQVVSLVE
ncbi:periplasmic binding protein-like II [Metschnikowia bicuspidata var. bicuspidata NRRL YB-4993]|uniref:Periplasmic binding protein-like II n=1 Tax=Metschnikowia bicuspidata var. bicuspidata NRRL YB-4993 TaxID=869754 RepID=A0A1A0H7E1_9ASCO|nr:periplasmic binding protein-like II [Metschnikowia bicuspidata var. bicuspidata NRRL YB-4993]OBA19895.1 periplasmic binding protein-like II [Metschnikowia bicuspidata var. bicuspidata NRRL YB-4993]